MTFCKNCGTEDNLNEKNLCRNCAGRLEEKSITLFTTGGVVNDSKPDYSWKKKPSQLTPFLCGVIGIIIFVLAEEIIDLINSFITGIPQSMKIIEMILNLVIYFVPYLIAIIIGIVAVSKARNCKHYKNYGAGGIFGLILGIITILLSLIYGFFVVWLFGALLSGMQF